MLILTLKVNSFITSRYYLPHGRNEITRPPLTPLTPVARKKAYIKGETKQINHDNIE